MRTLIKYAGCLALIGLPVMLTPPAHAQSGGTTLNATQENSNNTGGHAPDSAYGYKAKPSTETYNSNYYSNGTNGNYHYRGATPVSPANYTNTGDGPAESNDNPNLNSGGHGGGQAR